MSRYFPWQFGVDYDVIGRGSAQDLFDEQLADIVESVLGRKVRRVEWSVPSPNISSAPASTNRGRCALVEPP